MRLLIDIQACQSASRGRGVGRFSFALTDAIIRASEDDEVWLLANNRFADQGDALARKFPTIAANGRIVSCSVPGPVAGMDPRNDWRARTSEALREAVLLDLKPDIVLLSTLFDGWSDDVVTSIGVLPRQPLTAVIHYDLIPLLNEEAYLKSPGQKAYYHRKLQSLRQADLLLAISDYSRREAIGALACNADQVVNIGAAAGSEFRPVALNAAQRAAILQRFGIDRPFVLCAPGGFDSRKNLARLIDGYSTLPAALRSRHRLVITSAVDEGFRQQLHAQCQRAGLAPQELVLTGQVADPDLVKLYNLCELFVFPSLHEGFGLPALEAMSCGAATIGSNATSLVEVMGWDEAMFDPTSVDSIGRAIERALSDAHHRRALTQHALKQARRFSWDVSAKKALSACRSLVTQAGRAGNVETAEHISNYRCLIDAVTNVRSAVSPAYMDLVSVARAISENEATIAAIRTRMSAH